MSKVYWKGDANPQALAGKRIVVLGYGSQGRAQALNLRDSGYDDFDADLERVEQVDGSARLALMRNLDLFARGYYSFESNEARGGSLGFLFMSDCGCWDLGVAVEHRTRPSDTRLEFSLRLSGLGGRR